MLANACLFITPIIHVVRIHNKTPAPVERITLNKLFAGSSTSPAVRRILRLNLSVLLLQLSINLILR